MTEPEQDSLRLKPSNTRSAILFIAMLVWFGIGAYRFAEVGGILWLALALVGLTGALVYGVMLLPGSSYLQASPEALTICTAFRKRTYAWKEIDSFSVENILNKRVVKYELHLQHAGDSSDDRRLREETLPDTYGLSPEELAKRLNDYRRRYS